MKHLLQCHFLQTSKLSDALYKFWKLFLDNHSHVSIEYSILWLLLFDAKMVFNLIIALGIRAFKSMSCTRRIRFHQWYALFTLIYYVYRCLKSLVLETVILKFWVLLILEKLWVFLPLPLLPQNILQKNYPCFSDTFLAATASGALQGCQDIPHLAV